MKKFFEKIMAVKPPEKFINALNSRIYPFVNAAVALLCYYLGLDLVFIYYLALTSVVFLLFAEDLTPLITNFLFMSVIVSEQNSPSTLINSANMGFYSSPAVLGQIVGVLTVLLAFFSYRVALTVKRGCFKITPTFYGLCALAVALILNGLFSADYKPLNLLYGVFLAFFFLGIYALMKDNLKGGKEQFENLAFAFVAFSITLIIMLVVKYATTENIIVDGVIKKGALFFGWGIWNTMGMLLTLCIPPIVYLAGRYKHGYLFFLYAIIVTAAAVFSMSRQAMVGSVLVFVTSAIVLLVYGKNKLVNGIITGVLAVAVIVVCVVMREKILKLFDSVFATLKGANGRFLLWETAWQNFLSSPLFGTGFFADVDAPNFDGLNIVPEMYHNTVMQLFGACGIAGFATYAVHRVQTIKTFFSNVNEERTYIAILIVGLLAMNLVDNHLFYMLPTLIYSSMIALLEKTKTREKPKLLKRKNKR
ncbi:MAG: O-antigen ligase family protein [Clostridia bacterium]|nr:O-antigen ligase family protein [Clostridia bacterium]